MDEPSRTVWRIGYWVYGGEGLSVEIDAETCELYVTSVASTPAQPATFSLTQNYPNPFNPSTSINYGLPVAAQVKLVIYNTLGQEVKTLLDSRQSAGEHSVVWDGTNNERHLVPSGLYIYRIKAGDFTSTRKMILTR
jgi:hypothetical protein